MYGGIGCLPCLSSKCMKLHPVWLSRLSNVCNFSIFGECTNLRCMRDELEWVDLIKGKTDPDTWKDSKTGKHHPTFKLSLGYNYRVGDQVA